MAAPDAYEALAAELKKLVPGRPTFADYERLCRRIIAYLFDFTLPARALHETSDKLSRYDCVCRIKSTGAFWKFVRKHLTSQYVIFEFKNYEQQITQGQVLTTEKYLYANALRRVGIIFCRRGASKSATNMARGAMREDGKLILIVNDKQICKMLKDKDQSLDASETLYSLADELLMTLSR